MRKKGIELRIFLGESLSCLSYLLKKKKKQLLERPNTDEMERGEAENSNERSRRKFVRFLE